MGAFLMHADNETKCN